MSIEFLGHKQSLLDFLLEHIQQRTDHKMLCIADLFCGTGAVSAALKARGHRVIANDALECCVSFAGAALLNNGAPRFSRLFRDVIGDQSASGQTHRYEAVLSQLNELKPVRGFFWKNYSPASERFSGTRRMYFTEDNAARIDAVRSRLSEWQPHLTKGEYYLLLSDLLRAANSVSNTAGTYGCYLKHWKQKALSRIVLRPSNVVESKQTHRVHCADANELVGRLECDVIYADPPYTKRQYSAYYHILETLAVGDEPDLEGSTGLPPWKLKASDYCYRSRAPHALDALVKRAKCKDFFLSYNEDGQIPHDVVLDVLSSYGDVTVFETTYRRYKSARGAHKGATLTERLYHLHLHRHKR